MLANTFNCPHGPRVYDARVHWFSRPSLIHSLHSFTACLPASHCMGAGDTEIKHTGPALQGSQPRGREGHLPASSKSIEWAENPEGWAGRSGGQFSQGIKARKMCQQDILSVRRHGGERAKKRGRERQTDRHQGTTNQLGPRVSKCPQTRRHSPRACQKCRPSCPNPDLLSQTCV